MSKSKNETAVIYEPTILYSSSYSFSIGNSLMNKNNNKVNSSIFTPLWKTKKNNKKIKHSKTRCSLSMEKLQSVLIKNLKRCLKHKGENKRCKSLNEERKNSSPEKNKIIKNLKKSDLIQNYDELIEKLKRSPPQIKNTEPEEIKYFNLVKIRNFKKQMTLDERKIKSEIKLNNKILNPKKINSSRLNSLQYHKLLSSDVKNFTNTENINDFYEYTERCMEIILELDKSKQVKIKEKINFHFPEEESYKKIVLFDLDETLAHCIGEIKGDMSNKKKYKHIVDVTLPSKKKTKIGVNIRPHWEETMKLIKKYYQIVIYTASHQSYADAVLNYMDPQKKYTKYRLYRNHCVQVNVCGKKFYIKDLDIFDKYYDLKNIIIIDNSVLSFAYHLNNGIPIVPYYDSQQDSELLILGYYLLSIYHYDDLREANKIHIRIDLYLEKAKNSIEEEEEDEENEDIIENDKKSQQSSNNKEHKSLLLKESKSKEKYKYKYKINASDNQNNNIKNIIQIKDNHQRHYSINIKKKLLNFDGLSPTRKVKRKITQNEGLNIFDVWKDIRSKINEKNPNI